MKLIKRKSKKEYKLFSNKEAQYIAESLLSQREAGVFYMWDMKNGRTNQHSTPFRSAMCILKCLLSDIKILEAQVTEFKEKEKEVLFLKRKKKKEEEEERYRQYKKNLSNAYCGLPRGSRRINRIKGGVDE